MFAFLLVLLVLRSVHEVNQNNQQLHFKEIKLRNIQSDLEKLDQDYKLLEQDKIKTQEQKDAEIKRLQEREQQLQSELEAKRLLKEQEAKTYAESIKPRPTASVQATGSCAEWIANAGITDLVNANELIRRESNCNPNAINRSSGACGVAQELPCGKSGCKLGDGACQIKWMQSYVLARYGSWAKAVAFHNANNWY